MEEIPISAGLQIIDADLHTKGIARYYRSNSNFDSLQLIEDEIKRINVQ
jgi:hypothetical protein